MACFVVPAAEAILVTAVAYSLKKKEMKLSALKIDGVQTPDFSEEPKKIKWSRKLSWLAGLLWGGVFLLTFEHLWHGEVVPFPPFLTAMFSPEDTHAMLFEMATVGTAMSAAVTAVWGAVVAFADAKVKLLRKAAANK